MNKKHNTTIVSSILEVVGNLTAIATKAVILVCIIVLIALAINIKGKVPLNSTTVLNKPVGNNFVSRAITDFEYSRYQVINTGFLIVAGKTKTFGDKSDVLVMIPFVGWYKFEQPTIGVRS